MIWNRTVIASSSRVKVDRRVAPASDCQPCGSSSCDRGLGRRPRVIGDRHADLARVRRAAGAAPPCGTMAISGDALTANFGTTCSSPRFSPLKMLPSDRNCTGIVVVTSIAGDVEQEAGRERRRPERQARPDVGIDDEARRIGRVLESARRSAAQSRGIRAVERARRPAFGRRAAACRPCRSAPVVSKSVHRAARHHHRHPAAVRDQQSTCTLWPGTTSPSRAMASSRTSAASSSASAELRFLELKPLIDLVTRLCRNRHRRQRAAQLAHRAKAAHAATSPRRPSRRHRTPCARR